MQAAGLVHPQLDSGLQIPGRRGRAPYRGWDPFEEIDAGVFFGRDAAILPGLDELRGMRKNGLKSLFVVLGPSGSGRSSFLRAGLLPRLRVKTAFSCRWGILRPAHYALTGDTGLAAGERGIEQSVDEGTVCTDTGFSAATGSIRYAR